MAETTTARVRADDETTLDSIMGWFSLNSKQALAVLAAIVIVIGGWWFYSRSQALKAEKAEKAYYQALQSVGSGNTPLAVSDLRKLSVRYPGTRAAIQGTIALAQILYEDGKYAEGLAELNKVDEGDARKAFMGSALHRLKAAGLEQQNKFAEAAAEYGKAAEVATYPADRSLFKGDQARALTTAGKRAEAKAIWTELAQDEQSAVAAEAKVRLGELGAAVVK
jgi:predicted negative regulator of RcsB-dependent stress response